MGRIRYVYAILMLLFIPVCAAEITGDLDRDRIVTDDELGSSIISYLDVAYLGGSVEHPELNHLRESARIHTYYPRTIIDSAGRNVTIYRPVERIVALAGYNCEALRSLKAEDKLVGVSDTTAKDSEFFPEISKLPSVGTTGSPDIERIVALEPDIVLAFGTYKLTHLEEKLKGAGIEVFGFYFYEPDILSEEINKLGYLLERENEAEKFNNFHEGIQNSIKNKTRNIPETQKPRIYHESFQTNYQTGNKNTAYHWIIGIAGGVNIGANLPGGFPYPDYQKVDPEWVVQQNPDIIIKGSGGPPYGYTGYEFDDSSWAKELRVKIMNRPELENISAVRDGRVYIQDTSLCGFLGIPYYAKILHPDIFSDLDPQQAHQEYLTEFQRLDYNLSEHGVLMYPEP